MKGNLVEGAWNLYVCSGWSCQSLIWTVWEGAKDDSWASILCTLTNNCTIRFGAPEENQLWGRHIMTLDLSV